MSAFYEDVQREIDRRFVAADERERVADQREADGQFEEIAEERARESTRGGDAYEFVLALTESNADEVVRAALAHWGLTHCLPAGYGETLGCRDEAVGTEAVKQWLESQAEKAKNDFICGD